MEFGFIFCHFHVKERPRTEFRSYIYIYIYIHSPTLENASPLLLTRGRVVAVDLPNTVQFKLQNSSHNKEDDAVLSCRRLPPARLEQH